MVRSAMLLAPAFPELRGQAEALSEQLNELVRVMTSIRTEGEKLRAETARLNDARMRLAGLQETKRQSLAERQAELAQGTPGGRRHLQKRVGPQRSDLQARQGGRGAAPGSAPTSRRSPRWPRSYRGEHRPIRKPAAPAAGKLDSETAKSSVVLAPSSERVAMLTPGRIKPAMPFPEAKGPAAAARPRPAGPDIRRENPIRQPIQGTCARDPPRRPGRFPLRWLDRLRWRVSQLRPALDHQCWRRLSYSSSQAYPRSTCNSANSCLLGSR